MLSSLKNFDPLIFLDIDKSNYPSEDAEYLRDILMNQMGSYVLLKLSQKMPEEQFKEIISELEGKSILDKLSAVMPNWESQIEKGLEDFKTEYDKQEN
ncbi:MAG TPA: hypothetical protein VJG66_03990 [Patescibacteria group bacterium]|nr:hypothetical protein [Patescibacteria group bacterium]